MKTQKAKKKQTNKQKKIVTIYKLNMLNNIQNADTYKT